MSTVLGRSWLYLHLAADGSVLYAGLTYCPETRAKQHRSTASWWPQVAEVITFGPYLADHARRLERHVIELLDPPHNLAYTTRWEWHAQNRTA